MAGNRGWASLLSARATSHRSVPDEIRVTDVEQAAGGLFPHPVSPGYSRMPSRGIRDGSPPTLLARESEAGVLAVRRGG
ncbi:protein of unknown function [Nitrospira defluvii]|uniref:Uncharacterized protein n=1 Tax=Nitrospira defluvii TaxID=330214 RepID=D8PJ90_9BACT|nr:protein of unknown function [Nitrospira defluvii]